MLLSWCVVTRSVAQAPKPGTPSDTSDTNEEALSDEDASDSAEDTEHSLVTQTPPAAPQPPPPPIPPPPGAMPSPFTFLFKGTVALTLFAQDTPSLGGNGLSALTAPAPMFGDSWIMGGDVRQTRFALTAIGPQLLDAATLATVELEFGGGNQITSVGNPPNVLPVTAGGMPVGAVAIPFQSAAGGDESVLPRLRTAIIEFNWGAGTNVLRAGQNHNLLLAMVSASGAHPAVLGYGAGQLGWRAPSLTYSHRFTLSESVKLDAALQINRNSWIDNASWCVGGAAPPTANCLPYGVSLGEAGLPQVEGRLMLLGPLAESPWPHYAPTLWQLYVVGHWDQKDLSGVGLNTSMAVPMLRDTLTTYIVEAGGKVKLGPLLLATNGWVGQNAGQVFGHVFQMQGPDKPDVTGFGIWGQAGFSFSRNFSLWMFAGVDQPNRAQAIAAGFSTLRNMQLCAMLAYVNGPFSTSLEWMYIATTTRSTNPMTMVATEATLTLNQPSLTFAYAF